MEKLLWVLFVGTKGGINRAKIINELNKRPYNVNQLAEKLGLDYKTVQHHMGVLEKNKLITSTDDKYGKLYFLSDTMKNDYHIFQEIWNQLGKS
jgi:DNA-binding transcriptional ArsR family regulator